MEGVRGRRKKHRGEEDRKIEVRRGGVVEQRNGGALTYPETHRQKENGETSDIFATSPNPHFHA